ncbi:hypothetical protein ACLB2K_002870 [Fragaria x ananassa]
MGKRRRIKKLRAKLDVAEDKLERKSRSVRKLKREVKRLMKRLDRKEKRDQRRRERRERKRLMRVRDLRVRDIIETIPIIFRRVWSGLLNQNNRVLWLQADSLLQKITREVMDEVACRWSKNEPLPILNRDTVKVRDDKPIIPKKHSLYTNHAERFREFILSVFGPAGDNRVLEDFLRKLSNPELSLFQFQNLYFHKFLQSREGITAFPVLAVQNLRRLEYVTYNGRASKWIQAYKSWVQDHYPEGGIDLETTCSEDIYAWRAFNYRFYRDDPIDEADLVRNLISHFNECRAKDIPASGTFDLKQVGEVVFSLFPDIYTDLFDFLYECNVYLDFHACRTYYRDPVVVAD